MPSRINRIFATHSLQTQVLKFYAFNGLFVHNDKNIILSDFNPVSHIYCVSDSAFLERLNKKNRPKMLTIPIFVSFKHLQCVLERST